MKNVVNYALKTLFCSALVSTVFALDIDMSKMTSDQMSEACFAQGKKFSTKIAKSTSTNMIDSECRNFIKSLSNEKKQIVSADGRVRVLAGLNIIYIDIEKEVNGKRQIFHHIISGPNANLHTIEAVSISNNNKRLAVLHNVPRGWATVEDTDGLGTSLHLEKEIRVFNATMSGNVLPRTILRDKDINTANYIKYNPGKKEIFIIQEHTNKILTYASTSDYRRVAKRLKPKALKSISPSDRSFREPASIEFIGNKSLLILDKNSGQVVSLDPISHEVQWVLDKEAIGLKNDVSSFHYNGFKGELIIFDYLGNQVSFSQK